MSAITTLLIEGLPLAANDDLIGWSTEKLGALETLMKTFAVVAGIAFVILQAIASRGAMARVVISGLAAGLFIWIVLNVELVKDRVDSEINSAPEVTHVTQV
ncbi:hypothetical protein [Nocardioides limicola]|uniref:hypothetical protein n=1 Tax=Nocardioides limicola TaxID=2803368 RepID=UPI00193C4894|nr:hypothetical protein [Nocardioides sp. DJM-14]